MAVALVAAFAVVYSYVTVTAMSVLGRRRKESSLRRSLQSSTTVFIVEAAVRGTPTAFSLRFLQPQNRGGFHVKEGVSKANVTVSPFFFLFLVGNFEHG